MDFINFIKNNWVRVFLVSISGFMIGIAISLMSGFEHVAESKIVIIQKNKEVDAYSLVKSQEVLARLVKEIIYTQFFINTVYSLPFRLQEQEYNNPEVRMKNWQKKVKVSVVPFTGIIKIITKDRNDFESLTLNSAVLYALRENFSKYHGKEDNLKIEPIDPPYVTIKHKFFNYIAASTFFLLTFAIFYSIVKREKEESSLKVKLI